MNIINNSPQETVANSTAAAGSSYRTVTGAERINDVSGRATALQNCAYLHMSHSVHLSYRHTDVSGYYIGGQ